MAETYAFAIGGALLLGGDDRPGAVPAAVQELEAGPGQSAGPVSEARLLAKSASLLEPSLAGSSACFAALLIVATVLLLPNLGASSCPPLEEGHIWIRGIFPVSISLDQTLGAVAAGPRNHAQVSRGRTGRQPTGPARFAASTRPASTVPSSSCRSSRSENWPATVQERAGGGWFARQAAAHQARADRTK